MNDPTGIKRRYRQFADMECKGYSDVYYGLALAVSEDDEVVGFIAEMPVVQPNLFLASVQLLTGPDGMPRTGSALRAFLKRRGGEVGDVMRSRFSCVWPAHRERRRRLEGAIDLARAKPPAVSAGDLVEDLPAVLAEVPDDAQLVVFHSAVLNYVSPDRRQAFADTLAVASKRRDIVWLSNEAPGVIREVAASAPSLSE